VAAIFKTKASALVQTPTMPMVFTSFSISLDGQKPSAFTAQIVETK